MKLILKNVNDSKENEFVYFSSFIKLRPRDSFLLRDNIYKVLSFDFKAPDIP